MKIQSTSLTVITISLFIAFLQIGWGLMFVAPATAHELTGFIATEGRFFFNSPLNPEQKENNGSISVQPEYYHEFQNGSSFTITPFVRLDSADSKRSSFDLREFKYQLIADSWELQVGVDKVFWGVTEFLHLVDIINQTDLTESIDGEEKLGQPMVHFSLLRDWGVVELFVLPYFRERMFPGENGRLRTGLVIDQDNSIYESSAEEHHMDFALRYSHTIGDWDIGLSHFQGTSREPTLLLGFAPDGEIVLIPYYEQIAQTSLDAQLVVGAWLLKLEAIYRTGQDEQDFFASTGGFEYTLTGIVGTNMDLGVIAEFAYDERGEQATTPFNNDLMAALRLVANNAASSELLAGIMQDLDTSAHVFTLEASHRLTDHIKVKFEAGFFFDQPEEDLLYSMRDDDYLRLELFYYF